RKEAATQAETRAKADAAQKLATLTAERDKAKDKIKEMESAKQRELEQQRLALEKDRDDKLRKQQGEQTRERDKLQKKVDALTRQLQQKTANELGDGAEIDVFEALRTAFARDEITRVKKGQPGADIRQEVLHKGASCGTILFDSKN